MSWAVIFGVKLESAGGRVIHKIIVIIVRLFNLKYFNNHILIFLESRRMVPYKIFKN